MDHEGCGGGGLTAAFFFVTDFSFWVYVPSKQPEASLRHVPIPDRMSHLKIDARGYPIPYGVFIDAEGLPHFAINDEHTRLRSVYNDDCSICGKKLFRGRWLVGGPLSALHKHGAFIDPPMHSECAHYALQVCPYLAAPRYAKEIGLAKIKGRELPNMILVDPTMIPGRPANDVFVAIMVTRVRVQQNANVVALRPYSRVEFWRHGEQITRDEGERLVGEIYPELFDGSLT